MSVIDGHMVSLLCDVQAYPPPEVIWTRDGQLLHLTTGVNILPGQGWPIISVMSLYTSK